MDGEHTFRVLSIDEERGQIQLDPIEESNDEFLDGSGDVRTVSTESNADVETVISFLSPGHVVRATLEDGSPGRITSIEHRGGAELRDLDPRTVPLVIRSFADGHDDVPDIFEPQPQESSLVAARLRDQSVVDPLAEKPTIGEMYVCVPSKDGNRSWGAFRGGEQSESIYGSFRSMDGSPAEILVGNPQDRSYWYALIFKDEGSTVAQKVLAQFGSLDNGHYTPDPSINLTRALEEEHLPANPDENPRDLLGESYQGMPDSLIPEQAGQDTIDMLAEFLLMVREVDFFGSFDSFEPNQVTVDEYESYSTTLYNLFHFHVQMMKAIYQSVSDGTEADDLMTDGEIPSAELFAKSSFRTASRIHRLESYLDRMEQVEIEMYVHDLYTGGGRELKEKLAKNDIHGSVPNRMRASMGEMRELVEDFQKAFEMCEMVVQSNVSNGEVEYDFRLNEDAFDYVNDFMSGLLEDSMGMTPGGEHDPEEANLDTARVLGGQITQRYDWLDPAASGPMGEMWKSAGPYG
ncbi:hypothetical protein [Halosegnis rubeus]|uniref:Uncharacterized protein n=1 Tax=Halosegnis rubeus TaxID=2212850 RepID=A0A5N5U3M0_9EURY|nr:hypothetical protein [Halosegnis rubeus]KAB7513160.1 hypothetical protein DMP03_12215 [Halosegnis rubeus]